MIYFCILSPVLLHLSPRKAWCILALSLTPLFRETQPFKQRTFILLTLFPFDLHRCLLTALHLPFSFLFMSYINFAPVTCPAAELGFCLWLASSSLSILHHIIYHYISLYPSLDFASSPFHSSSCGFIWLFPQRFLPMHPPAHVWRTCQGYYRSVEQAWASWRTKFGQISLPLFSLYIITSVSTDKPSFCHLKI